MADWVYMDWEEQATAALQLARLRRHITEVRTRIGQIGQSVSANGSSKTNFDLVQYLKQLTDDRTRLEQIPGVKGSGQRFARFVDPGVRSDEDC